MATVKELSDAEGPLDLYEPTLGFRQQALRLVYVGVKVMPWISEHLPEAITDQRTEIQPIEQLDDLLNSFCAGEPISIERQIKLLRHWDGGVWEMKTLDLRLFGWFPQIDTFICNSIDFATRVKRLNLYAGYRGEVIRFRDPLPLDEPKFIQGDDPHGVITNVSFT
ncbi:MAG: hypothetical protein EOO77_20930 [Oxalobacteraceae bacterium]|nr:MAG: hypothetical protein EOO77_20930 [Oxalobacteraceae bacterium]